MEVSYSITLHPLVTARDIPRLDAFLRQTIRDAIREKLTKRPEVYGKPLRYTLKGCRSLRVGDHRVVFQIQRRIVHIVAVIHRRTEYRGVEQRLH
ncbi:MAG: type II toxin-antitoxin system RelE/ParE family toxin [Patescibacteria group bacterium]